MLIEVLVEADLIPYLDTLKIDPRLFNVGFDLF